MNIAAKVGAFVAFGILCFATANGADPVPNTQLEKVLTGPIPQEVAGSPVDSLIDTVYRNSKSAKARALKRAYLLLENKHKPSGPAAASLEKILEARKIAAKVEKDPEFSDYALWISGTAYLAEAGLAYEQKKFRDAIRLASKSILTNRQIEIENPYSPLLKILPNEFAQAELVMGNALSASLKWKQAIPVLEKAFQRLQATNSLGTVRPESLRNYSQACGKLRLTLCISWAQKLAAVYPKSSEEMRALLKYFPESGAKPKPARVDRRTQTYRGPDLDVHAFELAMTDFRDGHYDKAAEGFRRFLDDYPRANYRFRARYWLAQAMAHEKDSGYAKRMFEDLQHDSPLTFYGMLASMQSGIDIESSIEALVPLATNMDPQLQPVEVVRLRRAEKLIAEGAHDFAALELRDLRPRDALASPFLMYLATLNYHAKSYWSAFSIIGELIQRGYDRVFSTYVVRMTFPTPHWEIIQKFARENSLDPILVLSLIKQESAFETRSSSSAGAQGLMQLMPATAVETISDIVRADLLDTEANIRVGTKYLGQLMNRFHGNVILALAGYNAGPNAVDRWLRDERARTGPIDFIEAIPYRETREYVGSILRNYFWYSRQFKTEIRSVSMFWNTIEKN